MRWPAICLALLFLPGLRTFAQPRSISGQILTEASRHPVESAYIMLCHLPDSLVVAFGRSNAAGKFAISFTPEVGHSYFLKVSHLSFREATQPLSAPGEMVEFLLKPGNFTLHEVQITAQMPIREQGDSTRYRVESFAKGEQTIEEVLKKMPNVRVEDNGDIYFKNKKIEKVFLDGDDLIGNNYQLATRSIDPAVLQEVQAIEHFSENKLLRQIEQSDKTVLNLTVKDKRKTLFFGSADVGAGPQRHDAVGSLFSYHRAFKAFSVLSANNVGTARLELPNENSVSGISEQPGASAGIQPFMQTARPFTRYLNSPLENSNNERVGTLNLAVSPVKALKITTNWTFFRDYVQASQVQSSEIFGDMPFAYQQTDNLQQHPTLMQGQLQATYDWSKTTALVYKAVVNTKRIGLDQNTYFTNANAARTLQQAFSTDARDWRQSLELTQKLNPTNALVATVQLTHSRLTEQLNIEPTPLLTTALFGSSQAGNTHLNQGIGQQNQLVSGRFSWLSGTKKRKFEQQLGYIHTGFAINLLTNSQPQDGALIPLPVVGLIRDSLQVVRQEAYILSKASLLGRKVDWSGIAKLSYVTATLNQRPYSRAIGQLNLSATYRMGDLSRFVLSYDMQTTPVSGNYLLNSYVLTDFRSAQRGVQDFLFDQRNSTSLTYLFSDVLLRKMTLFATVFRSKSNIFWSLADYLLLPDYSTVRLVNTPGVSTNGVNVVLEKLVFPLSGNIRVDGRLLCSQFHQIIDNQPRTTTNYMPVVTVKYISVFESPFNMELGGTYRFSSLLALQNEQLFRQSFSKSMSYARLFVRKKAGQISLTTEYNRIRTTGYLFLKVSAVANLTPKLSLRVDGINIINQRAIRQPTISPTTYLETNYSLLPRMLLAHLHYSF